MIERIPPLELVGQIFSRGALIARSIVNNFWDNCESLLQLEILDYKVNPKVEVQTRIRKNELRIGSS